MRATRAAFTLIELLVVIAIVMVLSAILLSSFAQARNQARSTQCLSNVRQITQACLIYVEQFERLPIGGPENTFGHWMSLIGLEDRRGVKLRCPAFHPADEERILEEHVSGYAVNSCLEAHSRKVAHVEQPSRVVAIAEHTIVMCKASDGNWDPRAFVTAQMPDCLLFSLTPMERAGCRLSAPYGCSRHNGGANYGFLDGSSKWVKPTNFRIWYSRYSCIPDGRTGHWIGQVDGYRFLD